MPVETMSINKDASGEVAIEHIMTALSTIACALMNGQLMQVWMLWDIRGTKCYDGAGLFANDPERRANFLFELKMALAEVEKQQRKFSS